MKSLAKSALVFVALGLALYCGAYYAAERIMHSTGRSNAFFKIAQLREPAVDWLILGASHAMPLDFADFNAGMERETGLKIVNLAAPGAGPLYNRFVLEHFLREHRARNLLYVLDSFAFYSSTWNEERFADAKLLRRTPFGPAIGRRLWDYSRHEGVDALAVLDYLSGFSKINNRERFERDVWEGEAQFERAYRPSTTATTKRIAYLYPGTTSAEIRARYLVTFSSLLALAQHEGMRVAVIKLPVPPQFRGQLPDEAAFDEALARVLEPRNIAVRDLSAAIPEPRFYFDTDHLNRAGLTEFFKRDLKAILLSGQGG